MSIHDMIVLAILFMNGQYNLSSLPADSRRLSTVIASCLKVYVGGLFMTVDDGVSNLDTLEMDVLFMNVHLCFFFDTGLVRRCSVGVSSHNIMMI